MSPAPRHDDPEAIQRRIRRSWRRLTGARAVRDANRPTLVACSGGADSGALAIALARTPAPITLGHVVHDLRPREQAEADRDAVRELASRLGAGFEQREIRVVSMGGNAEANARAARYEALDSVAAQSGASWIATAHHADDVLETVLMRLMRGSGPRGLGAIAPALTLCSGAHVVRPCLGVTRAELERVCAQEGWAWREDATNRDESRLRAALRARVLPELRALAPEVARRASESANLMRDAQRLVELRAGALADQADRAEGVRTWARAALRCETALVLGEALMLVMDERETAPGTLRDAVSAIRDESTDPRCFRLGGATLHVLANEVRLEIDRERESG